jgi:hypothetical protein
LEKVEINGGRLPEIKKKDEFMEAIDKMKCNYLKKTEMTGTKSTVMHDGSFDCRETLSDDREIKFVNEDSPRIRIETKKPSPKK